MATYLNMLTLTRRHCERSEAISQSSNEIAALPLVARNDFRWITKSPEHQLQNPKEV
jgi:hypothetical protein